MLGKASYSANCVACHGEEAMGDGPMASSFDIAPPNLTTLSDRSGGVFPFSEVYQIIEGSDETMRAHADDSMMPAWGDYFMKDSLADRTMDPEDAEYVVQGRILALVYYLQSIQK